MTQAGATSQTEPREGSGPRRSSLRVILFTNLAPVYGLAQGWAARHGYTLHLVVTTPGPTARRSNLYRAVVEAAPPEQDILITTRMRRLAKYLAPLAPDLIVSGSFPYRIPSEVTALARVGAYNFHPAPLPRYRGPNAARAIYDGQPMGATLHRTEAEFDAGAILYRKEVPLPADVTPENVMQALGAVALEVWEAGLAAAIAGAPGEPQNEADATYAALFSEDETTLDWNRSKAVLQRQATALNVFGGHAQARLDGRPVYVDRLDPLPDPRPSGANGHVVARDAETATVLVADGLVRVRARTMNE